MRTQVSLPYIVGALVSIPIVHAKYEARWVRSSNWYGGADGNWSSIGLWVGDGPAQVVDVLVSTVLAESWVVGLEACPDRTENEDGFSKCVLARGGVFNRTASLSWNPLGLWSLGLSYLGIPANGEYGVDGISMSIQEDFFSFQDSSIATITEYQYNNGFLGLGIIGTAFGQKVANSPLDAMATTSKVLKSRSYGYTAGAHYAHSGLGSPSSLTLGGFDKNRFVNHDVNFDMRGALPWVKLRGIEVTEGGSGDTQVLMNINNESVNALIDTTTPHLWLPPDVCDRFAAAFNLTWDEEREYYFLGGSGSESTTLYNQYKWNTDISFKFTLSDYSNNNLFDNDRSVINITVPIASFTSVLAYPFAGLQYGDPSLPYFTLKRSETNESRVILGRSFLQEAYLKANYDPPRFSVHQAVFPQDPDDIDIETLDSGLFPLAEADDDEDSGLSTPALAGIVFSICAVLTAIIMTWYCRRRRKKARRRREAGEMEAGVDDLKESGSEIEDQTPKSSIRRLLTRITRLKKPKSAVFESSPGKGEPVEVAADEDHERYELPVPTEPVELDADNDRDSVNGTTELGTEDTRNLSAYDIARRKLDRQLQGPVPAYTPPIEGGMMMLPPGEKSEQDVSLAGHYRPPEQSSPTETRGHGTMPTPTPSPLSPNYDWQQGRGMELPSPMTIAPPYPTVGNSPSADSSSAAASVSYPVSPHSYNLSNSLSRSNSQRSARSPLNTRHTQPPSLPSLVEAQTQGHQPTSPSQTSPNSAGTPLSSRFPLSPVSPIGGSSSADHSPTEPTGLPIQRTPIDPTRVVCLGPLPDNVRLPGLHQPPSLSSIPRVLGPDGRSLVSPTMQNPEANQSVETLGSNFTEEEEARLAEMAKQQQQELMAERDNAAASSQPPAIPTVPPTAAQAMAAVRSRRPAPPAIITGMAHLSLQSRDSGDRTDTPRSPMRIDSGLDIVHVPQVAERRFSWEEDR